MKEREVAELASEERREEKRKEKKRGGEERREGRIVDGDGSKVLVCGAGRDDSVEVFGPRISGMVTNGWSRRERAGRSTVRGLGSGDREFCGLDDGCVGRGGWRWGVGRRLYALMRCKARGGDRCAQMGR